MQGQDLAEIAITSGVTLVVGAPKDGVFMLEDVSGIGVDVGLAAGAKCGRCWQILPEVGKNTAHPELCDRCIDVIARQEKVA